MLLAIDPGNEMSGWCLLKGYVPIQYGKDENELILRMMPPHDECVIEMVASYGMSVGQTVFDTCVWVGRFWERTTEPHLMYRKDVKMNLCGNTKAKDSNIRQALVDRFSYDRHKAKGGKGVKADPGFFYGFSADIWQAMALGVTYLDLQASTGP
jgi:hypothetical protein